MLRLLDLIAVEATGAATGVSGFALTRLMDAARRPALLAAVGVTADKTPVDFRFASTIHHNTNAYA